MACPNEVRDEMKALVTVTFQKKKKSKSVLDETIDEHLAGRFGPTHEEFDPDQ